MAVELHEPKPFWQRHFHALIVGAFALLLTVIVVIQLWEKGDVARWLAEAPGNGPTRCASDSSGSTRSYRSSPAKRR